MLLGKKEGGDSPIAGEWHMPGGHMEEDEEPEEAVKREIKEETGLDVEVHQIVDVTGQTWSSSDGVFQVTYHCEAESKDAEASDDLQDVKWVEPSEIEDEVGEVNKKQIEERPELKDFLERIEKAPY